MIEKVKEDILEANDGRPSRVLDPFSGGSSILLEALKLGCEALAEFLWRQDTERKKHSTKLLRRYLKLCQSIARGKNP